MRERLARHWWTIALRGIAAIAFGLATLVLPGDTLIVLVYLFAAYALVDGVAAVLAALRFAGGTWRGEIALLAEGLLGLIAAAFAIMRPAMAAVTFATFVAVWAVLSGVLAIVTAIRTRRHLPEEWLWLLAAGSSVALGIALTVVLVAFPALGVVAFSYLIGMFALVTGFSLLSLAFRMRRIGREVSNAI